jgi:hypothetical protein
MVIACRAVVDRLQLLLVEDCAVNGRLNALTAVITATKQMAENFMF